MLESGTGCCAVPKAMRMAKHQIECQTRWWSDLPRDPTSSTVYQRNQENYLNIGVSKPILAQDWLSPGDILAFHKRQCIARQWPRLGQTVFGVSQAQWNAHLGSRLD